MWLSVTLWFISSMLESTANLVAFTEKLSKNLATAICYQKVYWHWKRAMIMLACTASRKFQANHVIPTR